MPKKEIKKPKRPSTPTNNANIEKALIENFIALQKVLTNLSVKFDGLSTKITSLLDLFEISAKALSEKDFKMGGTGDLSEKMDRLLDQNKTLAQGVSLLHDNGEGEDLDEDESQEEHHESNKPKSTAPLKKHSRVPEKDEKGNSRKDIGDYEQSISSESKKDV